MGSGCTMWRTLGPRLVGWPGAVIHQVSSTPDAITEPAASVRTSIGSQHFPRDHGPCTGHQEAQGLTVAPPNPGSSLIYDCIPFLEEGRTGTRTQSNFL